MATSSGSITASGQSVTVATDGLGTVGLEISGTWSATLLPQVSVDNVNFVTVSAVSLSTGVGSASITGNGSWQINCAGCQVVRISVSAFTSGTVSVVMDTSPVVGTQNVSISGGSAVIGTVKIQDSNGATVAVGQTTMAASLPVTIASNQGSLSVAGTAAAGVAASGNPVQIGGVYNTSAPAPATGQMEPLQLDSQGDLNVDERFAPQAEDNTNGVLAEVIKPLSVATYCPSLFTNRGANNTLNVKASAGNVFSLSCFNTTASVRYLLLHNTATVPVNTNVPVVSFLVPANAQIIVGSDFFHSSGLNFATGIAFAISSTMDTLTLATSTDQSTSVVFK